MARPASGYILKDGTKVPGTTTIAGRFEDKGGIIMWAHQRGVEFPDEPLYQKRDEAGSIGTFVHEMWEAHLRGQVLPEFPRSFTEDMRTQAQRALGAAVRWKEDTGLEIKAWEQPLVSELYHYGGTPDALMIGKRGGAVGDWKSGSGFYVSTWLQMAAYVNLFRENHPEIDISDGIHLVRFGKVGGEFDHKHIPLDHPALAIAWDQFVRFIDGYEADRMLKRLT